VAALEALKDLTSQLFLAGSGDEIGRALFAISKRFGFTSALVVDMTQLFNRLGPAIVFSALGRAPLELFDTKKPFLQHPFVQRARASDKPFVMSLVRVERGTKDEEWWSDLPPHLRDTDGIVVPVHDEDGKLAWYAGFAGREPDLSARTMSLMSAAAHAGYARFQDLLSGKTPRSPLSPREAECLRWIAEGKTDVEVGQILQISPRTVRFHINNAKAKLGVATRIQAVAKRIAG
jgi:DNA-binding CsgD family transcriptional regulator